MAFKFNVHITNFRLFFQCPIFMPMSMKGSSKEMPRPFPRVEEKLYVAYNLKCCGFFIKRLTHSLVDSVVLVKYFVVTDTE